MISAAIHFASNYRGTDCQLNVCLSDARAYQGLFGGKLVLGKDLTLKRLREEMRALTAKSRKGKYIIATFSGHGTQVPDLDGDEPDHLDEAFVMDDLNLLVDDDFRSLTLGRRRGSRLLIITDCCFSGTNFRAFDLKKRRRRKGAKFVPFSRTKFSLSRGAVNAGPQRALPGVVHLAACTDDDYAYEDRRHGVLTQAILGSYRRGQDVRSLFKATCERIREGSYGQLQFPQLNCSRSALRWKVPVVP